MGYPAEKSFSSLTAAAWAADRGRLGATRPLYGPRGPNGPPTCEHFLST